MRLCIEVEVDETNDRCEKLIDELRTAVTEDEGMSLATAGMRVTVKVIDVDEIAEPHARALDSMRKRGVLQVADL